MYVDIEAAVMLLVIDVEVSLQVKGEGCGGHS